MIVNDLDHVGITLLPDEADTPLVVDPYAVLPSAVALLHRLKSVTWQGC
jgi:hypothetical protein